MQRLRLAFPLLVGLLLAGCSASEEPYGPQAAPRSGAVTFDADTATPIEAFAYRLDGASYRMDTLFDRGWVSGRLSVRMPGGDYRFLVVAGRSANTSVEPSGRGAAWDDFRLALTPDPTDPERCLPPDELFLQDSAQAARAYTLRGESLTVPVRLRRAVGQVVVSVKRGVPTAEGFEAVPYAAPASVLDAVQGVRLGIDSAARTMGLVSSTGCAALACTLETAAGTLTEQGFVRCEGPFLFPTPAGGTTRFTLDLVPAAGAAFPGGRAVIRTAVERNVRTEITLWITHAYPQVGIEIDRTPIGDSLIGDEGVWD